MKRGEVRRSFRHTSAITALLAGCSSPPNTVRLATHHRPDLLTWND
jgi:hypothetical protein